MLRHLILGNGAAGITAAKKLRELRPDDEIFISSDEPYSPYSRCLLADYIAGKVARDELSIFPSEFYRDNRIKLLLGDRAIRISVDKKKVIFKSSKELSFDTLLIATGASPVDPPIPGIESSKIASLRNIADADRIIELANSSVSSAGSPLSTDSAPSSISSHIPISTNSSPNSHAACAVIGGGFIGLEVAHALRKRGLEVLVVEMMPHILFANLDEPAAAIISHDLSGEGIRILTGNDSRVMKIEELEGKLRLHLASGGSRDVDFALHSTGVMPNIDVVLDSPIRTDRGILVNEYLETNVQGIFAAGDVAQAKDLLTGEFRTSPIWPNAVAQGKLAAYNMVGMEHEYTGEVGLQNAMEFRQVPAIAFGHSKGTGEDGFEVITVHKPEKGIYKKLVLEKDVVKGMIFVGDVSKSGIITNLIKSGRHIGELKDRLLDEQFSLAYFVEERTPTFDMYVGSC